MRRVVSRGGGVHVREEEDFVSLRRVSFMVAKLALLHAQTLPVHL